MAADFVALELPQAVLGRDRAAEARHRVVDDPVHRFALGNQRLGADVVMQVAVAHVAEDVRQHAGKRASQGGSGALDQLRGLRHRHRDVVLDVGKLRLRNGFAQPPQRARLLATLGEHRVAQHAALGAFEQGPLEMPVQQPLLAAVGEVGEHVPGMRRSERILKIF